MWVFPLKSRSMVVTGTTMYYHEQFGADSQNITRALAWGVSTAIIDSLGAAPKAISWSVLLA